MTNQKVIAVLVTYNKLSFLQRAVAALKAQSRPVDNIIVVDNASTDGTRDWLAKQQGLEVLSLASNTGGAGGFYSGVKRAHLQNADWIWLMDDDCIANQTTLNELMEAAAKYPRASFFNSLVLWKDGSPCRMNVPQVMWPWTDQLQDPKPLVQISACSFVSCLVNGAYLETIGYPIRQFFIWFDDFEYTQRLSSLAPGYLVPQSTILHETAENLGVDWSKVNKANYWKFSFGLRNESSLMFHGQSMGLLKVFMRVVEVSKMLSAGRVPWILRLKLWRKVLQGIFMDYRKLIEKPDQINVKRLPFSMGVAENARYGNETWSSVWGNDHLVQTHPPQVGESLDKTGKFIIKALEVNPRDKFVSTIYVADARAEKVKFYCEVLSSGVVTQQQVVELKACDGNYKLELEFDKLTAPAVVDVVMYCLMSEGAAGNYFASSFWLNPRIVKQAA